MPHQITIKPSDHSFACPDGDTVLAAAMAADLMLPYGCRNGACGTCKGKILDGRVDYGPHQASTLTDDEKRQGLALFCCAKAGDRSRHRGEGSASRRRHPDPQAAVPDRVDRQARAGCRDREDQAAGERTTAVPGRPVHRSAAEGWPPEELLARDGAARRRAARTAHSARARRLLLRAAVRTSSKVARSCASRGRSARSSCARNRTSRSSSSPAAPDSRRSRPSSSTRCTTLSTRIGRWCCTGACARSRTSICRTCPATWQQASPNFTFIPVLVGTRAGRRLARTHRLRPSGGARRFRRPLGLPGLRVRRSGDDRHRTQDVRGNARTALRRVLRRQLHVRRRNRVTAEDRPGATSTGCDP